MPKTIDEWINILLCMKTGEDFVKLSDYLNELPMISDIANSNIELLDKGDDFFMSCYRGIELPEGKYVGNETAILPGTIGYRCVKNHDVIIPEADISFDSSSGLYVYKFPGEWSVTDSFNRNIRLEFHLLSDSFIEFGLKNLMPVTDSFTSEGLVFRHDCTIWSHYIYGSHNITIKTKEPVKFPIIIRASYESVVFVPSPMIQVIRELVSKNKITKVDGYWQNTRSGWTSERFKMIR